MNTIQIYSRSYIKDDKTWSMSEDTIKSVRHLLEMAPKGSVKWLVFISGIEEFDPCLNNDNWQRGRNYCKFLDLMYDYSDLIELETKNSRCSTGAARQCIFNIFENDYIQYGKSSLQDFLMNLDDDDELTNQNLIVKFINSGDVFHDLVGFGLDVPEWSEMRKEWYWDKAKFDYSRKYVTTDTQTMFLFLHRFKVIQRLLTRGLDLSQYQSYPVEDPEDTHLAIAVAKYNKDNLDDQIKIDAICANFIRYNIHEGQTSNRQSKEGREAVQSELKSAGYLYVNGNFFKESDLQFIQYQPKKPTK